MDDQFKLGVLLIVVGVPVFGSFVWGVTDRILKHREKVLELQAMTAAEKAAQYAAHTDRLEQRVRVLERIATDKGVAIADEIERLRDTPLN